MELGTVPVPGTAGHHKGAGSAPGHIVGLEGPKMESELVLPLAERLA
jgi:hypothetical protein